MMRSPLSFLLSSKKIRQKVVHFLRSHYFNDLGFSIPVANGYWAQILEKDAYDSFSEIFVNQEYKEFLPPQKPEKLIDLGANYGYFSLWLQSIYPKVSLRSALVEPSTKCYASLERLVLDEQLEGRFRLFKSCIGNPSEENAKFYERPYMASSMKKESRDEEGRIAPILKSSDLREYMPPPFDLLKCDIEGSEWQLLLHYQEILSETRHLILEWHSWHDGGGGRDQIISTLKSLNFSILKSSKTMSAAGRNGEVGLMLAANKSICG